MSERCSKYLNYYNAILATFQDPRYKGSFFSNYIPNEEEEKYQNVSLASTEAKMKSTKEKLKQIQAAENSDTLSGMSSSHEKFDANNEETK